MRYRLAIQLDSREIVEPTGDDNLARLVACGRRLAAGGWWEVWDAEIEEAVASAGCDPEHCDDQFQG